MTGFNLTDPVFQAFFLYLLLFLVLVLTKP